MRGRVVFQREEGEKPKKGVLYIGIIVAFVIAYCGLGLYLDVIGVNTYISETKQIVADYDFLDLHVGENQNAVYFVGSSIIGCGIDAEEINRILSDKGYDIVTYNLGLDGDDPLQRSLSIQNIIDSKPSLVIFGETYNRVTEKSLNEENIFLVRNKLKIRFDSLYLYTLDEIWTILKPHTFLDDKRFIDSAKAYKPKGIVQTDSILSNDLYTITYSSTWRHTEENNKKYDYKSGVENEVKSGSWSPKLTDSMTNAKEALLYNVKTLQDAEIPVIILNMPLHPLISNKVTKETRANFFNLLDSSGAKWYDYEFACPDDEYWYKDGHHIAPETGAKKFAPVMADLIIQEMT